MSASLATLTERRRFDPYDVWVQFNPTNGRYRWRCPSRLPFAKWSRPVYETVDEAFEYAERTIKPSRALKGKV